jgi:hypothetical protein
MRFRAIWLVVPLLGCSSGGAASPFVESDSGADDSAPDGPRAADVATERGPGLGGPCDENRQCNDRIDCTFDSCNLDVRRCEFIADDARCQNDLFCDGVEQCDLQLGCTRGGAQTCADETPCTIDKCIELTRTCQHAPRDADGDGSPDGHCMVGGDCDDGDPTVYAGRDEICGNKKDDNCDGEVDESPCRSPLHDTCLDPLIITASGLYDLDLTAAAFHYGGTCAPMEANRRDVVGALQLSGEPRDVDIVVEAVTGVVALGLAQQCDKLAAELACAKGLAGPIGNQVARIRLRSLSAGIYPLYVWTDRDGKVLLRVTEHPATTPPTNETCGTAAPLSPGVPISLSLTGTVKDLASRCESKTGDLVFSFALDDAQDVTAFATSLDGYGTPIVSLRRGSCATLADEISCGSGSNARAFARALPKGTYYVAVSATAPIDLQLEVDLSPPTGTPPDDKCEGAPLLVPNKTTVVSLLGHTDDVDLPCGKLGSVDAAYAIELAAPADVLLVERISRGDVGAISLHPASCSAASSLTCGSGGSSPVRATSRNVPAGSYRAVVESTLGNPMELTAFVRPAIPPALVPFADTCATAPVIGSTGGFFQGNTANASADYSAGCDITATGPAGAPDQMLKLVLSAERRVIFDMQGSGYATLLDLRKGDTCPGAEVPGGCSAGYLPLRSYLDLTLEAGTYWVQVDGYGGEAGPWFLDVRIVEP